MATGQRGNSPGAASNPRQDGWRVNLVSIKEDDRQHYCATTVKEAHTDFCHISRDIMCPTPMGGTQDDLRGYAYGGKLRKKEKRWRGVWEAEDSRDTSDRAAL